MKEILDGIKQILVEAKKARDIALLLLIIWGGASGVLYWRAEKRNDLKDAELQKCHEDGRVKDSTTNYLLVKIILDKK